MSGAQKRKQKKKNAESLSQFKGSIDKFLSHASGASSNTAQASTSCSQETEVTMSIPAETVEENLNDSTGNDNVLDASNVSHEVHSISLDPASWPCPLQGRDKEMIILAGPEKHVNCSSDFFPRNQSTGRRFTPANFYKIMPNGEKIARKWLVYSKKSDAVFCFCCKLFISNIQALALTQTGFSDWVHIGERLKGHEKSSDHMASMLAWYEAEKRLAKGTTIDQLEQAQIQSQEQYWKGILERLICIVQFLAERNMALRGSANHEYLGDPQNGNFLGQIELMAKYDPLMAQHIAKIKNKEIADHYLGKRIQNEIIQLLSKNIIGKLIERIKLSKYYSIILDCTPDISHQEQMTLIIRMVNVTSDCPTIEEHFMGFIPVEESTGKALTDSLLCMLQNLGLSLQDCRGQGYDNGANMKGKNVGVQKRIRDLNPKALFVPCACHSLNLVVCDAAKSSVQALSYFGCLQRIFNLFSASTKRWAILQSCLPSQVVQRPSDTRWESKISCIKVFMNNSPQVHSAIQKILLDASSLDAQTFSEAQSLKNELHSFKFIVSTVIWHTILSQINMVSKLMQSASMSLDAAITLIQGTKNFLLQYRDGGFEDAIKIAEAKAISFDDPVQASFPETRPRKRKRFLYEDRDEDAEIHRSSKEVFKIDFFNVLLDEAITKMDARFKEMMEFKTKYGFVCDICLLTSITEEDLLKKCSEAATEFAGDVNSEELCAEVQSFTRMFTPLKTTQTTVLSVLEYLYRSKLNVVYPNLCLLLRLFLTVPVTVASGERSFSKLKLVKNYLRSTMSQERLVGLAVVAIEHNVGKTLDCTSLIKEFASIKARKVHFV